MDRNRKNNVSASELARQERARKFRQSRLYNSPITPEGEIRLGIFVNNLSSIRRLIRFGVHNFDDQGRILVQDDVTKDIEHQSGKEFLEYIISYFEQKDAPYAYRFCAQAKELLDVYNQKFGC